MRVGQTTKWLVKSNGRVLGPYNDRQVFDLLKDKIIVPLDEVSKPFDRWNYIRDEPIFARVVEEIRLRNMRGMFDDSTTRGEESTNVTLTTPVQSQPDELTAEISQAAVNEVNKDVQDIFFQSVDEAPAQNKNQKNVFIYEGDKFVKAQSGQTAKWAWVATTLVITATLGYVIFHKFIAQPIQNRSVVGENVVEGDLAFERGDYDSAFDYFERAFQLDQENTALYLNLGLLKTQVGNQPFQGRKLLEKLKGTKSMSSKNVLVGIGLSYLKEGDFKSAEDSFNKALDVDPLYAAAVVNLGATAIYQEDWPKASNHLLLAVKDGSGDGVEYVMLTEVLKKLYEKEKEKRYLFEGQKYLNDYLLKARNYYLEIKIGLMYLEVLLGDKKSVYANVNKVLDLSFEETESIKQDIYVHRSKADWGIVSQWCLKLTADLDPDARIIAFEAMCLMKSGDVVEANKKINDALAQAPKDPLVLSTSAYVYEKMSTGSVAVAIQKALDNDSAGNFIQPLRLKAQQCQKEGDRACAKKYWEKVLAKNSSSLDALANLAMLSFHENNIAAAKNYLAQGMNISSRYKPFFSLNLLITKDGKAQRR